MKSHRSVRRSADAAGRSAVSPPHPAPAGHGNAALADLLHQPLPYRDDLEAAFGVDLSGVAVHTGLGDRLAPLGAQGVALGGERLLFADARPSRDLVAHEVAHLVQSGVGTPVRPGAPSGGRAAEQEADAAATEFARGGAPAVALEAPGAAAADGGPIDAIGDWIAEFFAPTPEEEMAEFRARTFAPLLDHRPSSGGMFDVAFDAAAGRLTITLKVGYRFVDGDPANVVAGFRPEEFQWTPLEEALWRISYQASVSAQWSGRHTFQSTRPGWVMPITCDVRVVEDDADPHYILTVAKYPSDATMQVSSICPPGTEHDPGGDCTGHGEDHGTGALDSNDLRREAKLREGNPVREIHFGKGNTDLTADGTRAVEEIAAEMTAAPGTHATLTGRASADVPRGMTAEEGAIHNMDLARARSDAVEEGLVAGGVPRTDVLVRNAGADGATEDESWCRVDVLQGARQTQNPALHETGHMFGLGDEYPTSSAPEGDPVRTTYDAILRDQLGIEVTRSRTESAMSSGSTVERWHYVTFLAALKQITGMDEWTV